MSFAPKLLCAAFILAALGCATSRPQADAVTSLLGEAPWPAGTTDRAPQLDPGRLARAIHDEIGALRLGGGLAPLAWSGSLARLAEHHSQDMARHPFFGHTNPRGQEPEDRALHAGMPVQETRGAYLLSGVGENLLVTHRYREYHVYTGSDGSRTYDFSWKSEECIVAEALESWMNSPDHRVNLLSPLYVTAGVGIAHADNEALFITVNFSFLASEALAAN